VLRFEAALDRVSRSELLRSRGGPTSAAGRGMGAQDMVAAAGAAAAALTALESASIEGVAGTHFCRRLARTRH